MDSSTVASTVLHFVVSNGVGAVVGNTLKASTPANATLLKKVSLGIGTVAISGLVSSMAAKHTVSRVEETVTQLQELKTAFSTSK